MTQQTEHEPRVPFRYSILYTETGVEEETCKYRWLGGNQEIASKASFPTAHLLSELLHNLHKRLSNPTQSLTTSAQGFFWRQTRAYSLPVNLTHTSYSFQALKQQPTACSKPSALQCDGLDFFCWVMSTPPLPPCNREALEAAMNPRQARYQQCKHDIALRLLDKPQYIIFPVPTPIGSHRHGRLWTGFPVCICLLKLTTC